MRLSLTIFLLHFAYLLFSAPHPLIPRTASQIFVNNGVFEGGGLDLVNLERIRFWKDPQNGHERWVIDFSSLQKRQLNEKAPSFKISISPPDKVFLPRGKEQELAPARILVELSGIENNYIQQKRIRGFLRTSSLVQSVRIYPAVEKGPVLIEWLLNGDVLVEPHQPITKEGRLVLDLKPKRNLYEKK